MFVKVSETYDLSTVPDKMGLVGIHTPDMSLFARHWGGAMLNHKKFKFIGADVAMACASMLPADPLQIGVEAGDIAPQDMFNPILYKACSNDSFNNILDFIASRFTLNDSSPTDSFLSKNSITSRNDFNFTDGVDGAAISQWDLYYGFLSNSDGWRKAMPQAGLEMKGLYPIVYTMVNTIGPRTMWSGASGSSQPETQFDYLNSNNTVGTTVGSADSPSVGATLRGPSMRMPPLPTRVLRYPSSNYDKQSKDKYAVPVHGVDADPNNWSFDIAVPKVVPCYVGAIILPPAKLNRLYYRLKVTWTVELMEPSSIISVSDWSYVAEAGGMSYGTDYAFQSKAMSASTAMVDASGANVEKVMEGS